MLKKNNRVKIAADAELKERLVAINRTTKVTKGGRTFTFAAIVVVGDGNGIIGYGLGKANEVTTAISKGTEMAKKNLIKVPVHKGTIPHEVVAKYGGSRIIMKPASAGTGVKAGGAMRAVVQGLEQPSQPGEGHAQGSRRDAQPGYRGSLSRHYCGQGV